ncbi:MAG: low-specificity L-threonine aldolase [Gammaproteobacteria bacterium]|nr:low-specificity L-threonine aldolase [Gammaproteobacteria bacterium]
MIDLRSDTVTKPCDAMRQAMSTAIVGDDVYHEDPTVIQLEQYVAKLTGKEAAIFAPSGTQTNLLALMAHCERGDEYIVGQQAHTYKYEGGGAAVLGSIQPQPLPFQKDATFDLDDVKNAIKPIDSHFARTKLICLENTHHGICLPIDYPDQVKKIAEEYGLQLHLDGARLFNASVKLNKSVQQLCKPFDSVSLCLSKGLGAPVGSVLVGSQRIIDKARRWRKVLGGGMRQAGILAAAGLYALHNNVQRLSEDHKNAKKLVDAIKDSTELMVMDHSAQTNMIFLQLNQAQQDRLTSSRDKYHITADVSAVTRLVMHKDITEEDLPQIIEWLMQ